MSKRFTSTEIWEEDWFLDMPNEYKLFWYYMLSTCNHAGIFKVKSRSFRGLLEVNITPSEALKYFNAEKTRIRVISESVWFVEDFFAFQYGTTFNGNSTVHESIYKIYNHYNIELTSVRGLKEVKNTSFGGLEDLKARDKDKDKDKDKDNTVLTRKNKKNGKTETGFSGNFKAQGEELFAERHRKRLEEAGRSGNKNPESEE